MKSSKGCTGNQGSEDSRSIIFKGYLEFGGVFYIGVEELGLISRNSCEGALHQEE